MARKSLKVLIFLIFSLLLLSLGGCKIEPQPKVYCTVTVINGKGGGVYEKGAIITLEPDTPEGKEFDCWMSGGVIVTTLYIYSFEVDSDAEITAVYKDVVKYYSVTADEWIEWMGMVKGLGQYPEGSDVTVTATLNKSQVFICWEVDNVKVSDDISYTFKITKDIEIFPRTEIVSYNLQFEYLEESDSYKAMGFSSEPFFEIHIPAHYNDGVNGLKHVTDIGDNIFSDYKKDHITKIHLGDTVERIGSFVFNLPNVTSITLPKNLKTIGEYCFIGCFSLREIFIPEKVEFIDRLAFFNSGLAKVEVDINNQHYSAVDGVLFNKIMDTLIYFPDRKTNDSKSYEIPATVRKVEERAFSGYLLTETITFEAGTDISVIGTHMFYRVSNVKKITIPRSVTLIDSYAFYNSKIGTFAFEAGSCLKAINDYAFNCTSLNKIDFPEGLKTIGEGSFDGSSLPYIILPDSLEVICKGAFRYSDITMIDIPPNVTIIDDEAFYRCQLNIVNVFSEAIATGLTNEDVFGGLIKNAFQVGIGNGCTATDYIKEKYPYSKQYDRYKCYSTKKFAW